MSLLLPRRAISRPERALIVTGVGTPITPGSTMTKVPGTTGDMYAGGGVTSGTAWRLVAPADGRYLLKANIPFEVSEAQEVEFGFVVNGTATGSERLRGFNPGASAEAVAHLVDSLDLSAGDYVEPFCRCTASGTASISVNLGIGLGLGMTRQSAVASAVVVPLLASNCLTFLRASTLAGSAGASVPAWNSLEDATGGSGPYDWTSPAPGIIDDTTMPGRRAVLFNGTSQYMRVATGMGAELAGTDVPFTRLTRCFLVSRTSNDALCSLASDTNGHFDMFRDRSAPFPFRAQRSGATAELIDSTGTFGTEEVTIVEIHHGATRTIWINGVKRTDAESLSTGASSFTTAILAAWAGSSLGSFANIAVLDHAYWNVAMNDTQAGVLNDLHGT